MKLLLLISILLLAQIVEAETTKAIINPYTGNFDFITALSSTTLPSGSANYIQNSFSPTIATQQFNVQQGEFSALGFQMTDANGCVWDTTISALGAIVTTLNSCPAIVVVRPCATGMSLGLLLSITCP